MTAKKIARLAMRDTQHLAGVVSCTVRQRVAIAEVAITVDYMDDSIDPEVRLKLLSDGIAAVREMIKATGA